MKKHLIAAAVVTAVAVPAMAQNVTISGALEAGYQWTKRNSVSDNTVSGNVFQTPAITFAGTEDLGGGLKASFRLTSEFNTATGAETGSNTADGVADTFEESSVSLAGNFGSIKLGRFNHTARDNGGVYRFAGEFARAGAEFRNLGSQPANSLEYTTPTISGFSASIGRSNAGTKVASTTALNQTSVSVGYAAGPLSVRASQISSDNGTAIKNKEQFVGATYDLGVAKIGALVGRDKSHTSGADADVTILNAEVPLGNGFKVQASFHDYSKDGANGDASLYGLALTKDLSKRTMVYVAYLSVDNEANATYGSSFIGTGTAGKTDSGTAIGVRHTF